MPSQNSHRLLTRLHKDLSELLESPYPGVDVFTDDSDLRSFCLVLTPPSGPFQNLALHFDVSLPDNWPTDPPVVSSSVNGIRHPNLFGSYICCDLIKREEEVYRGAGYTGGYTPALTLRGLFLQFLTFFSSTSVEQDYGGVVEIGSRVNAYYVDEMRLIGFLSLDTSSSSRSQGPAYLARNEKLDDERAWNASDAEEELLAVYNEMGVALRHSRKKLENGRVLHRLTKPSERYASTLKAISKWICPKCPYGSEELPHVQDDVVRSSLSPAFAQIPAPDKCCLGKLNADTLFELSERLSSEDCLSFAEAYPPFRSILEGFRILLHREVRCFFLRTSISECIMGVGVSLDSKSRVLSSDFDWLSREAFDVFKVRRSVEKRLFDYFLPLAFNKAHFEKAEPVIWARLQLMATGLWDADVAAAKHHTRPGRELKAPTTRFDFVSVIFKMMNNIVVALMKSCDDQSGSGRNIKSTAHGQQRLLHASEKAIISYCQLFHLVTSLARKYPSILREAYRRLGNFISRPEARSKTETPDMGELIVLITIVLVLPTIDGKQPLAWSAINGLVLEEAITRNVRWVLQAVPELEVVEEGASEFRLHQTFHASKTSLRLMMFQITFLASFARAYGPGSSGSLAKLDEEYGFPEKTLPSRMVEEIKAIYQVQRWPEFFQRMRYENGAKFSKASFSEMLRTALGKSAEKGYHRPSSLKVKKGLERKRAIWEKSWTPGNP